jgi:hypothetical protein
VPSKGRWLGTMNPFRTLSTARRAMTETMPAPAGLPEGLTERLQRFASDHDFARLYTRYEWQRDEWRGGFPDILKLEKQLTKNAKSNIVTNEDVIAVAKWAKHRNIANIQCPDVLSLPLKGTQGERAPIILGGPAGLATQIGQATKWLGPTTISKVLRFAVPKEFGAIDTRIVRVVGQGDKRSKREDWLSLRVADYGSGPHIPASQSAWPSDYQKWVNILRFFVDLLNGSGVACPHPDGFVVNRVRTRAVWACADVEMALFGWASSQIISERRRCRDA